MISTDTRVNVGSETTLREISADAGSLALVWLAGYLALSGSVLAAGGHAILALVHLALLVLAVVLSAGGAQSNSLATLVPLLVCPILYAELPQLITTLGTTYHDTLIQAWELALFHTQPAHTLAPALPLTALSELLHAGYLAYYPVIFVPPLLLFLKGNRKALGETILALTVTYTVCWTIFALFPVQGPRYLWTQPAGIPQGPFRSLATHLLAAGSSRGAAFPSSHMAVTVTQAMLAWRWQRSVSYAVWGVALLVGVGAVYGGFHYGVDMIAGALLGVATAVFVGRITAAVGRRVRR